MNFMGYLFPYHSSKHYVMILILTKSLLEISSDLVSDWLHYYEAEHIILTGDELLTSSQMFFYMDNKMKECLIINKGGSKDIAIDEIGAVWFRRRMDEASFLPYEELKLDLTGKQGLLSHLKSEFFKFYSVLPVYLKKAYWLSHPDKSSMNKLNALLLAKNCGLTIPETFITNYMNFPEIMNRGKEERFISKPLSETAVISETERRYSMLTKEIDREKLVTDSIVFPSLIQKCIEKEFEIRTFFLAGKFYSMAIFSQGSEKTKTDYRNYDTENENRCVPYQLPKQIEQKIKKLMREVKLSVGSIDIIKTTDGEYVFLEINPVGQFDWVALNCNYSIERDIALHLINKDNHGAKRKENRNHAVAETVGA